MCKFVSPFSSSDSMPPSRDKESEMLSFVVMWTLTEASVEIQLNRKR